MARRPIEQKKLARLRKQVNRRPLIAYVDLVRWLKDRGYAQTTGEAERLMTDGKVRVGSHAVGREKVLVRPEATYVDRVRGIDLGESVERWVPRRLLRSELRSDLRIQE